MDTEEELINNIIAKSNDIVNNYEYILDQTYVPRFS